MSRLLVSAIAAAALLAAGAASAHEYKAGDLMIDHPWSRATTPKAKVGGGFMKITNEGKTADRLVGVSAPFAEKSEIHESLEEDGVAKMRPVEGGVEIAPGQTVTFGPGGKHVMFMGLKAPLKQGEKVKGALEFEKAGKVEVEFAVEAIGAKPEMDHGAHDMGHGDHKM